MKKMLAFAAGAILGLSAAAAQAADAVTIQLKWVAQAQFAGYFVAKEKGFYKDAGLDVTIKPGGPDVAPPQVIAGGGADVVVDWMPSALASRSDPNIGTSCEAAVRAALMRTSNPNCQRETRITAAPRSRPTLRSRDRRRAPSARADRA